MLTKEKILQNDHLSKFVEYTKDFCTMMEKIKDVSDVEFADKLLILIPMIYAEMLQIPEAPFSKIEGKNIKDLQLNVALPNKFNSLKDFIGDIKEGVNDTNIITILIVGCGEVYKGLKQGLIEYEKGGDSKLDGLYIWQNNFPGWISSRLVDILWVVDKLNEKLKILL